MPYAISLTHSHTPNLEMLSHLKIGAIYVVHISCKICVFLFPENNNLSRKLPVVVTTSQYSLPNAPSWNPPGRDRLLAS